MRHALILGAAATLIAAVPATAVAATPWVGTQPVSTTVPAIQPSFGFTQPPVLDVSPSGRAVAAWRGTDASVLVSRRAPSGPWTTPQVVSTSTVGESDLGLDVTIDDAGDSVVMFGTRADGGTVKAATSVAGAAFGASVTVATGFVAGGVDIATNASGRSIAVFEGGSVTNPVFETAQASPGATWAAPQQISATGAGRGGFRAKAAINDSGQGVVTWIDSTNTSGSNYTYIAVARFLNADGSWTGVPGIVNNPVENYSSLVPVIASNGLVSVFYRSGASVAVATSNPENTFVNVGQEVTNLCNTGTVNTGGTLLLSPDGTRTLIYPCNDVLYAVTRAAGASFAGAQSGAQVLSTASGFSSYYADAGSGGRAVVVLQTPDGPVALQRSSAAAAFGAPDALTDPQNSAIAAKAVGLDAAGDAVALVGTPPAAGASGTMDVATSLLDRTPAVGGIDGPVTAYVGTLVTYSTAFTDAFGGLVGNATWSSTDGASGTGPTFERTFVAPGTYKITVSQKDFSGQTATAALTVTVTNAPPPTTPAVTVPDTGGGTTTTNTTNTTNSTTNVAGGTPPPPASPAQISAASLAPASFKVLAGKKGGSALTLTLTTAAPVDGVVSLQTAGVTKTVAGASTCAVATKKAKGKRCVRLVPKGTLHFGTLKAGPNTIALTGKVGNKKLAPGKYSLSLQIPSTNVVRLLTFTIKRS